MVSRTLQRNAPYLVAISSFIESYDYLLFGSFLFILAPMFFPETEGSSAMLKGFLLFGASFAVRPLGSLLFGHWSDRWGRKKALIASLLLMVIPTFVIAVLPGYAAIGIAAPILLTLARFTQVFSMGGEMTVAAVFLAEAAPPKARAAWAAFFAMAGAVGLVVVVTVGFIAKQPWMPEWGWRLPFVLGAVLSLIGLVLRTSLMESPEFVHNPKAHNTWQELQALIRHDWRPLLITILLPGAAMAPPQWFFVYMPHFLESTWSLPSHVIFGLNIALGLIWVPAYFLSGRLADRFGVARVIIVGVSIFALSVVPIFLWLFSGAFSFGVTLLVLGGLSLFAAMGPGPICALSPALFPAERRTMGWGLGWTLGAIIAAGSTPWLSQVAAQNYGPAGASGVVACMCLSTIVGLLCLQRTKRWKQWRQKTA